MASYTNYIRVDQQTVDLIRSQGKARLDKLKPMSEFFDKTRFIPPADFRTFTARLQTNLIHFQSNYLAFGLVAILYSLLTNLWLLFDVVFVLVGVRYITAMSPNEPTSLFGGKVILTQNQAWIALACLATLILWFVSRRFILDAIDGRKLLWTDEEFDRLIKEHGDAWALGLDCKELCHHKLTGTQKNLTLKLSEYLQLDQYQCYQMLRTCLEDQVRRAAATSKNGDKSKEEHIEHLVDSVTKFYFELVAADSAEIFNIVQELHNVKFGLVQANSPLFDDLWHTSSAANQETVIGMLLLAWGCVLQASVQTGSHLRQIPSKLPEKLVVIASNLKSILKGLLNLLSCTFTVGSHPDFHAIASCYSAIFRGSPDLSIQFWYQDYPVDSRRAILDSAKNRFPYEAHTFIDLCSSLSNNSETSKFLFRYLCQMRTYTFEVSKENLKQVSDTMYVLRSGVSLIPNSVGVSSFQALPNTRARLLSSTPTIVNLEYTSENTVTLGAEYSSLNLVTDVVKLFHSIAVEADKDLFVVMVQHLSTPQNSTAGGPGDEVELFCRILNKSCMLHSPPQDLIESCIDIIALFISHMPDAISPHLPDLLIIPKFRHRKYQEFGDLPASNYLQSVLLPFERSRGVYTVTLSFLHLVRALLKETRLASAVREEILESSIMFIHSEIFPTYGTWRYQKLLEKFKITFAILKIFNEIFGKSIGETDAGVLTRKTGRVMPYLDPFDLAAAHQFLLKSYLSESSLYQLSRFLTKERPLRLLSLRLLKFTNTLLKFRKSRKLHPTLLEHALLDRTVQATGRQEVTELMNVIGSYVLYAHDSDVNILAIETLTLLCSIAAEWEPRPPSFIGYFGSNAHSIVASLIEFANRDEEGVEDGMGISERLQQNGVEDGEGSALDTLSKGPNTVLDVVLRVLEDWKGKGKGKLPVLYSAVTLLETLWSSAAEHQIALGNLRLNEAFWKNLEDGGAEALKKASSSVSLRISAELGNMCLAVCGFDIEVLASRHWHPSFDVMLQDQSLTYSVDFIRQKMEEHAEPMQLPGADIEFEYVAQDFFAQVWGVDEPQVQGLSKAGLVDIILTILRCFKGTHQITMVHLRFQSLLSATLPGLLNLWMKISGDDGIAMNTALEILPLLLHTWEIAPSRDDPEGLSMQIKMDVSGALLILLQKLKSLPDRVMREKEGEVGNALTGVFPIVSDILSTSAHVGPSPLHLSLMSILSDSFRLSFQKDGNANSQTVASMGLPEIITQTLRLIINVLSEAENGGGKDARGPLGFILLVAATPQAAEYLIDAGVISYFSSLPISDDLAEGLVPSMTSGNRPFTHEIWCLMLSVLSESLLNATRSSFTEACVGVIDAIMVDGETQLEAGFVTMFHEYCVRLLQDVVYLLTHPATLRKRLAGAEKERGGSQMVDEVIEAEQGIGEHELLLFTILCNIVSSIRLYSNIEHALIQRSASSVDSYFDSLHQPTLTECLSYVVDLMKRVEKPSDSKPLKIINKFPSPSTLALVSLQTLAIIVVQGKITSGERREIVELVQQVVTGLGNLKNLGRKDLLSQNRLYRRCEKLNASL
ncbi:hypothetical protein BC829DRAFT_443212 [Chytridium lagenaria]|nr:hypothetical protein BC829DRAFT_443212 [Chytridium lagenaria]